MVIARRRKTSDESTSQVSSEASGDMSDVIFDQFQSERGELFFFISKQLQNILLSIAEPRNLISGFLNR